MLRYALVALLLLVVFSAFARGDGGDKGTDNEKSIWGYVLTNPDPKDDKCEYRGHVENLRIVLDLLRNACRVEWIASRTKDVAALHHIGARRGDYLVPMNQPNAGLAAVIVGQAPEEQRKILSGKLRCESYPLRYPRILVDAQLWAGNYYWYYDTLLRGGFEFQHLHQHNEGSFDPKCHNLFVVPGGGGRIPAKYNELLRNYVAGGGNYLGSCWGCAQAIYPSKVSYGSGNGAGIADARNNEVTRSFGALGGVGHIILRNDAPDHPIMWDLPQEIHNIYWNGPVMEPGEFSQRLASLTGVVEDDFRFHSKDAEQRRQDYVEEKGKCLYLTSRRPNQGKVTVFGNHPEASNGVNPFRAHPMGFKATYNAILYSTAGEKRTFTLSAPPRRNNAQVAQREKAASAEESIEVAETVRRQAAELVKHIEEKISEGRGLTEDDHSGFYLLRLRDALKNLARCSIAFPMDNDPNAEALRKRIGRWSKSVTGDLDKLAGRLATLNVKEMRRSTRWHAVACPIFERSIELTHLDRDIRYHNACVVPAVDSDRSD